MFISQYPMCCLEKALLVSKFLLYVIWNLTFSQSSQTCKMLWECLLSNFIVLSEFVNQGSKLGLDGGDSEWLAHLVSRFTCNTRLIVDASSNPLVPMSNRRNKSLVSIHQVNKHCIMIQTSLVNRSVAIKNMWWSPHMQSCK